MPGRQYSATNNYRYGFNGKENDNEVKGEGDQQDYGMRIYDPRLGRFLSVDPLTKNYPQLSTYQFASNRPLDGVDLDGKEWVLKIYDPQAVTNFLKAYNKKDIYSERWIAYKAITGSISEEELFNRRKANPSIDVDEVVNKTGQYSTGGLVYDKNAAPGVTFQWRTVNSKTKIGEFPDVTVNSIHWTKGKGAYFDESYPVDIRTVNSPESKDFYKDYDFRANYTQSFGSAIKGTGVGYVDGYLKGYGRVQYTTQVWGTSTPSFGVETGMITGKFKSESYTPNTLTGYGGAVGWGAGIATRGTWYNFANYKDMQNFNTANATASGEQNGISLAWSWSKLKYYSAYKLKSYTTLVSPKIK